MCPKTGSLERSTTTSTDSKDSLHIVEKVISNNRSCAWLIIRIVQITVCCLVLGLTAFLLATSISDDDGIWFDYGSDGGIPPRGRLTGTDISVYVPILVIIGVASLSLLSSLISLITYCCHRLSIKLIVFWDFLMSAGWIIGTAFLGALITEEGAWNVNYWVMDLYKFDLALGIIAILLFITSGGLGIRLHRKSKRRASAIYSPMRKPDSPPSLQQENYHPGTIGVPYRTYSNFTLPPPSYRPSGEWESVALDAKVDEK